MVLFLSKQFAKLHSIWSFPFINKLYINSLRTLLPVLIKWSTRFKSIIRIDDNNELLHLMNTITIVILLILLLLLIVIIMIMIIIIIIIIIIITIITIIVIISNSYKSLQLAPLPSQCLI